MCTATWWRGPGRIELFFNRDEQHTRMEAIAPAPHVHGHVRYLAPIDPEGKGTWILANLYGTVLALLNYYEVETGRGDEGIGPPATLTPIFLGRPRLNEARGPARVSRGQLVKRLAGAESVEAVRQSLQQAPLRQFWPFYLLVLKPNTGTVLFLWNGRELREGRHVDGMQPVTTSSFQTAAVTAYRRSLFEEQAALAGRATPESPDHLLAYHQRRCPERPAFGPLMLREDARTVSFSRVRVTAGEIVFTYQTFGKTPGTEPPPVVARLERHPERLE